jgi:hypothetical protein
MHLNLKSKAGVKAKAVSSLTVLHVKTFFTSMCRCLLSRKKGLWARTILYRRPLSMHMSTLKCAKKGGRFANEDPRSQVFEAANLEGESQFVRSAQTASEEPVSIERAMGSEDILPLTNSATPLVNRCLGNRLHVRVSLIWSMKGE